MMIKNITGVLVICVTAAVIGSSALELPPECNDYHILNDTTRNVSHGREEYCDQYGRPSSSPDWLYGDQWYRLMPPAGVVIPQNSVGYQQCGTSYPGWIRGTHPTDVGAQVEVELCFSGDTGDSDDCLWSKNILVTHCDQYYVYFLPETPHCYLRYCGADTL